MTEYRVYLLDDGGKIADGFSIKGASVQSVIAFARLETSLPLEIWQGSNRLAIVPEGSTIASKAQ